MPKPVSGINGSGLHLHQSLFREDSNGFYDADDEQYLSMLGKQFIAGLIARAPEITLVTNQWANSYKLLVPGYEAPVYISWTHGRLSSPLDPPAPQRRPGQYGAEVVMRYRRYCQNPLLFRSS
jgi:glutamine synthetase